MKRAIFFAALGLLFACGPITDPVCACSPPGGGEAVITGTVLDPADAPVGGATVTVRLLGDGSCGEVPVTVTRTTQSGADGRFRHREAWSGGRKCFRVRAEPPQGSALAPSEGEDVRIDFLDTVTPDSVHLILRLR